MTDKTIGRVAGGIALLAALTAVIFVADLLDLIPTGPFWESLFAGLLSGAIIVSLVVLLLPAYLRSLFAPQVSLEPEEDFALSRYLDSRLKGSLRLQIRNDGRNSIKSFYWHLIIPRALNPVVQDTRGRIIGARKLGEYDYIHGLVENQPVFPNCSLELPIRVALDTADNREKWQIKYSLSTEFGHCPREMGLHRSMDASALADCAEFWIDSAVHAVTRNDSILPLESAAPEPTKDAVTLNQ
ncbi:MAG: hypothetical protein V1738_00135 [Patescibacteria group bacterium]